MGKSKAKQHKPHITRFLNELEVLEIIMRYIAHRKDHEEIAKDMISRFGTIDEVFSVDYKELLEIEGLTESQALKLSFLGDFFRFIQQSSVENIALDSLELTIQFCRSLCASYIKEVTFVLFLTQGFVPIGTLEMSDKKPSFAPVDLKRITERALRFECANILIVHNHPSGVAVPSTRDISSTRKIAGFLRELQINLVDHIIVGFNSDYSFRAQKLLDDIWY